MPIMQVYATGMNIIYNIQYQIPAPTDGRMCAFIRNT
jgi:hypothetical protein